MALKEAAKKFNAYDQTRICDILPENPQISPKINLNRSTPKKVMINISIVPIMDTMPRISNKSFFKLLLFLNFSEILCSRTLEIEVEIRANGIDSNSFERSK